jgi:hypothetical protein
MTGNGCMKIFGGSNLLSPNRVVLHVIPNPLVRVKFRGIRRQEEKPKTILDRFYKLHHRLRCVRRVSVDNQKDHSFSIMEKPLDKFDKPRRPHSSLDDHEPKLTLRTHRQDHVQSKACSCRAYHRGLTSFGPRCSRMTIRPNPCFIPKENLGPLLASQTPNPGILLLQPLLHLFRSLLICPPNRSLRGQSQLPQETAHRSFTQLHIKALIYRLPNHFGCPEGKSEFQLQRILQGYGLINPSNGSAIQFRGTTSSFAGAQATPAVILTPRPSAIHCGTADSERPGRAFWAFTSLDTAHCALSQFPQSFVLQSSCIHLFHGYTIIIIIGAMSILF